MIVRQFQCISLNNMWLLAISYTRKKVISPYADVLFCCQNENDLKLQIFLFIFSLLLILLLLINKFWWKQKRLQICTHTTFSFAYISNHVYSFGFYFRLIAVIVSVCLLSAYPIQSKRHLDVTNLYATQMYIVMQEALLALKLTD